MSASWVIRDADLASVRRLADFLSLVVRPGDVIALNGELGAGKTTFARFLIRAVQDDPDLDVPSPTFALAQSYDAGRVPVAHLDCYRMNDTDELQEVGLDDALVRGFAIIEWSDRIAGALPSDRLDISFGEGPDTDIREVTFKGHGGWRVRIARLRAMMEFCSASSWEDARPVFLQGDASTRAYARLHRGSGSAILMDSPARPDGPPVKHGKPYSQLVHLAEDVRPFVAVSGALSRAGLTVPVIMAADMDRGFLIITDLGDRVYSKERGETPPLEELYTAAADVLVHLAGNPPAKTVPLPDGQSYAVPAFDRQAFETEAELLIEWFYPAVNGAEAAAEVPGEFFAALGGLYEPLSRQETGWLLRDYHSPNLLWLPEREGIGRVGVIDFQDALRGPAAYDLVSLLQDARRDIPAALEERVYAYYCEARSRADSGFDAQAFATAYAVLGAQRNSKILGIFARLAKRDGKHDYLAHIPRVSAYLERNLAHPALDTLRAWFASHLSEERRLRPFKL